MKNNNFLIELGVSDNSIQNAKELTLNLNYHSRLYRINNPHIVFKKRIDKISIALYPEQIVRKHIFKSNTIILIDWTYNLKKYQNLQENTRRTEIFDLLNNILSELTAYLEYFTPINLDVEYENLKKYYFYNKVKIKKGKFLHIVAYFFVDYFSIRVLCAGKEYSDEELATAIEVARILPHEFFVNTILNSYTLEEGKIIFKHIFDLPVIEIFFNDADEIDSFVVHRENTEIGNSSIIL